MRSLLLVIGSAFVFMGVAVACGSDDSSTSPNNTSTSSSSSSSSGSTGSSSSSSSSTSSGGNDSGSSNDGSLGDGSDGSTPVDPCGDALFCEKFDSYASVSSIADKQKFGPWHAALQTGATMKLDGAHKTSGANALHVHVDNVVTAGGRLFADGMQPIFATKPTHVYGRMMMYIDPNGTSIHWTFFGVNGAAEPTSPATGRGASYIMSSLPKNGVNTYSFVYGLAAKDADPFHDCSSQSNTSMPSTWACVAFEMDSVARKLRMYTGDPTAAAILSVDDHGKNCVAPTAVASPWYGPSVDQLYVGAWSFHAMNAPLDVWIDDLVVDTKPVSCPAQ